MWSTVKQTHAANLCDKVLCCCQECYDQRYLTAQYEDTLTN